MKKKDKDCSLFLFLRRPYNFHEKRKFAGEKKAIYDDDST